eukprot:5660207-Prymnesium_polylepis.1
MAVVLVMNTRVQHKVLLLAATMLTNATRLRGGLGRHATMLSRHASTKVGVVGLGLMGHGIAQVSAEKGFDVVAVELEQRFLDSGMDRITKSVSKLAEKAVKKGKMDQAAADAHVASTLGRIVPSTD